MEPNPPQPEPHAVRARRTGRDLTSGPIGPTLMLFALPVLASNMLQSLSGSTNVAWISHALGEAALTAASNANLILFLLLGAAFGASMAANLLIGQAIGSGDEALARKVVGTATVFFAALSLTVGVAGFFLTPWILDLLNTPPDAKIYAVAYLRVIFLAMPFMYFFNFLMMAQRATGDSRTPFFFSLAAVGIDMVLNPTLILGLGPAPRLGIAGSALATLTAQTLTLFTMLYYLHRKRSVLILRRSEWRMLRPDPTIIRTLLTKGLPLAFQMVVVSGSAVMMISMVNAYGVHTAAAYGAASQLWTYVQMPAMAVGAAVSAMAAQSVGAGRMDRLDRIAWLGSVYAALMSAGPIVLIYLFEPVILRLFLPAGSPSIAIAMHINAVVLWVFIFFAVTFTISGIVRATGSVWPPLLIMVVAMWVFRVPAAMLLQPYMGADAIWWSFPGGTIISCTLLLAYYRWGRWRAGRLLDDLPRGDAPDTGLGPPSVAEETEAAADLADEVRRSDPSAPNRPRSEAPAE